MEHFGAKKRANAENPDESKQQEEPCKQKKRGRKPKLTEEERKANKNERDRNGRKAKKVKTFHFLYYISFGYFTFIFRICLFFIL